MASKKVLCGISITSLWVFDLISFQPELATSKDDWHFWVPHHDKCWGNGHIISLWPKMTHLKCNFPLKCFSFAKNFNVTVTITNTERVAVTKLNNETWILNDLVIIKEAETHLEFIKQSRIISLQEKKKDYCKLQSGCQPHSFTGTKARFQKHQLFGKLYL